MRLRIFIAFLCASICAATVAFAAGSAGFVQGNIWYSKDSFFAGETVRIYSGVFNSGSDAITGTVTFFNNDVAIGTGTFSAAAGQVGVASVAWKASEGDHVLSAKITNAFISGTTNQPAVITTAESGKSERVIALPPAPPKPVAKITAESFAADAYDTAKKAASTVQDTVDTSADWLRAPLVEKKTQLEAEIATLQQKESTVVSTKRTDFINQATESSSTLAGNTANTPSDTGNRLLKQFYLWVVDAALFILDHKWLLYLILALVAYKRVRSVLQFVRNRRLSRAA